MDAKMRNKLLIKKSQVTIFIIIALIIIVSIILLFLVFRKPTINIIDEYEPNAYIEKCMTDYSQEAIDIMLPQGGYLNPTNYKLFENNKVAYLCYQKNFYLTCINQEPMYIEHLNDEIKTYIQLKVDACFNQLKTELEKRGYDIEMSNLQIDVQLKPKKVEVTSNRIFNLEKNGETRKFERFRASFSSPLYDLAILAQEIANQEAKYCNFEYLGFMLLYPSYSIDKKSVGGQLDASKIYKIEDRRTGKKLNIAIRSCAMPAGL